MAKQGTTVNLAFVGTDSEEHNGQLRMQSNNGNVTLSLFRELPKRPGQMNRRFAQFPDHVFQISSFMMIQMDPKDRLIVTLRGSKTPCELYFQRDQDIIGFLDHISQTVSLKHSDCDPCVFMLESVTPGSRSVPPFMATVLPQMDSSDRVSLSDIKAHDLVFSADDVVRSVTADEYRLMFDVDGRILESAGFPLVFFNVHIDAAVSGDVWMLLLYPEDAKLTFEERRQKREESHKAYITVKRQWQTTTSQQWKNDPEFRNVVASLERDLKANAELFQHFPRPKAMMQVAFNVLLTLAVYNRDGAAHIGSCVTFLTPFLASVVIDADETTATRPDGRVVPVVDAEADLFVCFTRFYDHVQLSNAAEPTKQPIVKRLLMAVGSILEQNFPALLQLLTQKRVFSLDCLREDCYCWFTTCFDSKDIQRLWMSIMSFSSTFQFFQCFMVSLLFSLAPEYIDMNPLSGREFVQRFHKLKKHVSLGLLLQNSQKILALSQRNTPE